MCQAWGGPLSATLPGPGADLPLPWAWASEGILRPQSVHALRGPQETVRVSREPGEREGARQEERTKPGTFRASFCLGSLHMVSFVPPPCFALLTRTHSSDLTQMALPWEGPLTAPQTRSPLPLTLPPTVRL